MPDFIEIKRKQSPFAFSVPLSTKVSEVEKLLDIVRFATIMTIDKIEQKADHVSDKYIFIFMPYFQLSADDIEVYRLFLQRETNLILENHDVAQFNY